MCLTPLPTEETEIEELRRYSDYFNNKGEITLTTEGVDKLNALFKTVNSLKKKGLVWHIATTQ